MGQRNTYFQGNCTKGSAIGTQFLVTKTINRPDQYQLKHTNKQQDQDRVGMDFKIRIESILAQN